MDIWKGLIVAHPWNGHILDGNRTWEMRPGPTQMRGPFALIHEATNTIGRVAALARVGWTLTLRHLLETRHLHRMLGCALIKSAAESRRT